MAEQFYTLVTNVGKAKIANANALGTKVNFSILKVGDSNGNYYEPTEAQENLVHEVWSGNINSITIDPDNPNWIVIDTVIPSNVGGFTIREAAIFDDEGNMLAIGKYPETYKPVAENGATKDLTIENILEVSNTAVVTLKVDPTVILATKDDLNNVKKDVDNLSTQMAENMNQINKDLNIRLIGTIEDKIYYVDGTNGMDSNDGSQAKPFKTIQHAIDLLPQCINHNITINIGAGTYNEDIKILGFYGKGILSIQTNNYTQNAVIVNSIYMKCISIATNIFGFTILKPNFYIISCNYINIWKIWIVENYMSNCGLIINSSQGNVNEVTVSNKNVAIDVQTNSIIYLMGSTGSGNNTALESEESILFLLNNNNISATTAQAKLNGGQIFS